MRRRLLPLPSLPGSVDVRWLLALTVAALAFLLYVPAIRNGTVIDDDYLLKVSLSPQRILFEPGPPSTEPYYRPITVASYSVLHAFQEGAARVRAAHIGNLLLHVSATLTVLWLCLVVAQSMRFALAGAGTVALLFAAHPAHSETVAWITARPDMIVALWVMAALYAYRRYRLGGGGVWLGIAGVATLAAPLSKEVGVCVFALLPAFEWLHVSKVAPQVADPVETVRKGGKRVPKRRTLLARLGRRERGGVVLLAAGLLYLTMRLIAFHGFGSSGLVVGLMRPDRLVGAIGFYAEKLFVPRSLVGYHVAVPDDPARVVEGCVAIAAWTVGLGLALRRRAWMPAFGLVWMGAALVPSLPPIVGTRSIAPIAERYLYLPSIGLGVVAAWVIAILLARVVETAGSLRAAGWLRVRYALLAMPVLGVLGVYSFMTVDALPDWKNIRTFWEQAEEHNPDAGMPHASLASIDAQSGNMEEARRQYLLAVSLKMDNKSRALAWSDLGVLYAQSGQYSDAVDAYRKGLELYPQSTVLHRNLALAYYRQAQAGSGDLELMQAAYEEAKTAVFYDQRDVDNQYMLCVLAGGLGEYDVGKRAVVAISRVDGVKGEETLFMLAQAAGLNGDVPDAAAMLSQLSEMRPESEWTRKAREQLRALSGS